MKKSEFTVSMPITAYEELMAIKIKHEQLIKQLVECYDMNNYKLNPAESIRFDYQKAETITREYLPYSSKDARICF